MVDLPWLTCPQTYDWNKKNKNDLLLYIGNCSAQLNDVIALNEDLLDFELACGNDSKFNISN